MERSGTISVDPMAADRDVVCVCVCMDGVSLLWKGVCGSLLLRTLARSYHKTSKTVFTAKD